MDIIDFFGNTVKNNFEAHPDLTRGFLRAGYSAQQLMMRARPDKQQLPSHRHLAGLSMKYTRLPLAHPGRSALVNIFTPCELLHALDIYPQCAEGFSSYLTGGRCELGFLDYAERKGIPETYCSYHKALLGAVFSGFIPKPRFLITTSTICDANTNSFRAIAAHYGMPLHYIDVPFEESPEAIQYVTGQLEALVAAMEEELHRKMNPARLLAALRRTNASVANHRRFLSELETKHFPSATTMEMYRIVTSHILMGTPKAEEFYRLQYEDAKRCGPSRGKRLLWSHVLPFYAPPLREALDYSKDVQLLLSDLNYDAMLELDEINPLRSMAQRLIRNHFNGPFERRVTSVLSMAKKLHADGAVLFCHFGCKQSNGGVFLLRDALQAEGIPTLVLDGDGCDRRNMSAGQAHTRLQAFLEILEARA